MKNLWEDLVDDFLTLACRLSEEERTLAINTLKREDIRTEHIEIHPAFSIDGRMMIVLRPEQVEKCYFYFLGRHGMEERIFPFRED